LIFLKKYYGKLTTQHPRLKIYMSKIIFKLSAFVIASMITTNTFSQKEQIPPPPPPPPEPPVFVSIKSAVPTITIDKFYKNNPSVAKAYTEKDKKIIVELKDGTKEKYNILEEKEKNNFINKYGALPLLPPPPPPPAPPIEIS
jgi:hypothetical protein